MDIWPVLVPEHFHLNCSGCKKKFWKDHLGRYYANEEQIIFVITKRVLSILGLFFIIKHYDIMFI